MILIYLLSLLLTIIIEYSIIYVITKYQWKKLLLYIVLINCFTWPLAIISYNFGANFYLIELVVILTEAHLLMLLLRKNYYYCLGLSLFANTITAMLSFLY